jgi:hypothetical protein
MSTGIKAAGIRPLPGRQISLAKRKRTVCENMLPKKIPAVNGFPRQVIKMIIDSLSNLAYFPFR